jgi:hypothetical protein
MALGDPDQDAVGPVAGDVDVPDRCQTGDPSTDGAQVQLDEVRTGGHLGGVEDLLPGEQRLALDVDVLDGQRRADEHQPDPDHRQHDEEHRADHVPPDQPAAQPLAPREPSSRSIGRGRAVHSPSTGCAAG